MQYCLHWILNNSEEKWEADFCGFLVCKKFKKNWMWKGEISNWGDWNVKMVAVQWPDERWFSKMFVWLSTES